MQRPWLTFSSIAAALAAGTVLCGAQEPPPAAAPQAKAQADTKIEGQASNAAQSAADAQFEVLTRGPIHEAFAARYLVDASMNPVIEREPPEPIEEIPPPARPQGEGVVWIPGYWGWDAENNDFLWVSGTYRNAPPNHRWTPGYWSQVEGGYRWTSGFWAAAAMEAIQYYSQPPKSVERGPSSPPPGEGYFWAPGSYVPQEEKYVWQPGYWVPYQANYVWTPAQIRATQAGYIYTPGYWDHRLDQRGALFAPVRVNTATDADARLQLTPSTIIPFSVLQYHLFAQPKSNAYLFGDYYGEDYAAQGIQPWYQAPYIQGVADPLFGYYDWAYGQSGVNYADSLGKWNQFFTSNAALRPAATLAAQLKLANSGNVNAQNLAASLIGLPLLGEGARPRDGFIALNADQQTALRTSLQDLRVLANNRLKLESSAPGIVGAAANTALRTVANPLTLPRVETPRITTIPAAPQELIRGVGGAVRGLVPGAAPGGQPGGGVLPGILPGAPLGGPPRGDDRGGGVLPPLR